MKRTSSFSPPLLSVGLGAVCMLLRLGLYAQKESSGLLPYAHPLHIASLVIGVLAVFLIAVSVMNLKGSGSFASNFPASRIAACGSFFAGLWLLPAAFSILESADTRIGVAWAVSGFCAVPCLIYNSWCRFTGRRTHFLLHGSLCLFYLLTMLCRYRLWSGNPQIPDYLFPLFGCVFLALATYYRMQFALGQGQRRALLFCGLTAGFCCIASLAGEGDKQFYLSGALWALTDLCSIQPPPYPEEKNHVSA